MNRTARSPQQERFLQEILDTLERLGVGKDRKEIQSQAESLAKRASYVVTSDARIDKAFTAEEMKLFSEKGVDRNLVDWIACIKDQAKRAKTLVLISVGMNPTEAVISEMEPAVAARSAVYLRLDEWSRILDTLRAMNRDNPTEAEVEHRRVLEARLTTIDDLFWKDMLPPAKAA